MSAGMPSSSFPAGFLEVIIMKKKKIFTVLAAFICIFCLTVLTFADTGNPYQDSHGQGYSEYVAGSRPNGGNTGGNTGLYNGSNGNNHSMPGSGTGNQYTGNGAAPGSGGGSQYGGNGGMPGSGSGQYGGNDGIPGSGNHGSLSGSGASNPYPSGLNTGGYGGGGSSTSDHFDASLGSDGSITLSLPGAEGVTAGNPSSAISLVLTKYRTIALVVSGVCTITAILSLLFQITKLGAAGDNDRMRAVALKGIGFSGAALAVFGSLAVVVGFFWNLFV